MFLKTHKCASSTLMNIFLRYGVAHDLNFVLPKDKSTHYIGHPVPFRRGLVEDISKFNMTYNILTHHTRYNDKEIRRMMPPDSVYVTIFRRPDSLFESLYSYCHLSNNFKKNLTNFVLDKRLTTSLARRRQIERRVGFNQMSFDLGFNDLVHPKPAAIAKFIESIEKSFDLIMLAERLDESLILLKHLLCWNTSDIVAFKLNARYTKYKEELSPDVRKRLLELNAVDVLLYDHFAEIFERKVNEFGADRMAAEVQELQRTREAYYEKCVKSEDSMENVSAILKRKDVIAFKLRDHSEVCRQLTRSELEFHEYVKAKQILRTKQSPMARLYP